MKRFAFELALAAALAAVTLLVWSGQAPDRPLAAEEIDGYLAIIAERFPFPPSEDKAEALARLRAFAERDDGRDFYMLNLLRFHEKMAIGPDLPAGAAMAPVDANAIYERHVLPIAFRRLSLPVFAGPVREPNALGDAAGEDGWSRVLVMHYPSRRHFFELLTDPDYLKFAAYKSYAMHIGLVPVARELNLPDLRLIAAGAALVLFLSAAWLRALLAERALARRIAA